MDSNEMSAIIENALNQIMPEIEDYDEGDFLVDWVVVGYVTNPDPEKKSGTRCLLSNDTMPTYRILGLLHDALHRLTTPNDD